MTIDGTDDDAAPDRIPPSGTAPDGTAPGGATSGDTVPDRAASGDTASGDTGVAAERIQFRVVIHESADVTAAVEWWAEHVGAPATSFLRPTLKRHTPRTVRRNVGDGYRGCLVVDVKQSRELYWVIEGIVAGTVRSVAEMPGAIVKLSLAQDVSVEKG
ncbi:MAG: hypothetical protein WCA46_09610 [Actinocatenispora sp.]